MRTPEEVLKQANNLSKDFNITLPQALHTISLSQQTVSNDMLETSVERMAENNIIMKEVVLLLKNNNDTLLATDKFMGSIAKDMAKLHGLLCKQDNQ